jgi:hypothetical protein
VQRGKIDEMPWSVSRDRRCDRPYAQAQSFLAVASVIAIIALGPVQGQCAGVETRPHSPTAFSASDRALTAGEEWTGRLLGLMDEDKNGVVSKEEFLRFMSKEFDRLDANRNDQLEHREIMRAMCRGGRGPLLCDMLRQY